MKMKHWTEKTCTSDILRFLERVETKYFGHGLTVAQKRVVRIACKLAFMRGEITEIRNNHLRLARKLGKHA